MCALTKSLLQRLLGGDAAIKAKRLDDGGVEGEPCAGAASASCAACWCWCCCLPALCPTPAACQPPAVLYPEDRSLLAVVFPTADRLKQLQAFAKEEGRPLLIVNPQWRNEGQVVSDFGIGPWKAAAEKFLAQVRARAGARVVDQGEGGRGRLLRSALPAASTAGCTVLRRAS